MSISVYRAISLPIAERALFSLRLASAMPRYSPRGGQGLPSAIQAMHMRGKMQILPYTAIAKRWYALDGGGSHENPSSPTHYSEESYMRVSIPAALQHLETKLDGSIKELRAEGQQNIHMLRAEIQAVRTEGQQNFQALRAEIKESNAKMEKLFEAQRKSSRNNLFLLAAIISSIAGILATIDYAMKQNFVKARLKDTTVS